MDFKARNQNLSHKSTPAKDYPPSHPIPKGRETQGARCLDYFQFSAHCPLFTLLYCLAKAQYESDNKGNVLHPLPLSPPLSLPLSLSLFLMPPILALFHSHSLFHSLPILERILCYKAAALRNTPLSASATTCPNLPSSIYIPYLPCLPYLSHLSYLPFCYIQSQACLISRILASYRITDFLSRPTRASFARADCPS